MAAPGRALGPSPALEVVMIEEIPNDPPLITISPALVRKLRDPRVIAAVALIVAGAVAEIVGYFGVSGTIDPGAQMPYIISGGIGGLFLLGLAACLLISTDNKAMRDEIAELRREIRDLRAEEPVTGSAGRTRSRPARRTPA
jgi:hypothetical protein